MRQIKAHKAHESEEAKEEANLKAELDADTQKKQALELKSEEKGEDLKHLLSMDKEASVAKTEKVHSGKASLKMNADAKEEAALRSKLNAEVWIEFSPPPARPPANYHHCVAQGKSLPLSGVDHRRSFGPPDCATKLKTLEPCGRGSPLTITGEKRALVLLWTACIHLS